MTATNVAKLQLNWPIEQLQQELASIWGPITVECLPTVDSTNSELQRRYKEAQQRFASIRKTEGEQMAQMMSLPAMLLIAENQTAGRGRHGKVWQSHVESSLTFSIGIPVQISQWSGLSLVVGLAIAKALHPEIGLKWPNDLWLKAKKDGLPGPKLGGILIEAVSQAQIQTPSNSKDRNEGAKAYAPNLSYLIVGVGLNIAPQHYPGLDQSVGCLQDIMPQASSTELIAPIASSILQTLEKFQQNDLGFLPFYEEFIEKDVLAGHTVTLSDGREGLALGVDQQGQLLVKLAQHTEAIISGEASVRPIQAAATSHDVKENETVEIQEAVMQVEESNTADEKPLSMHQEKALTPDSPLSQ